MMLICLHLGLGPATLVHRSSSSSRVQVREEQRLLQRQRHLLLQLQLAPQAQYKAIRPLQRLLQ